MVPKISDSNSSPIEVNPSVYSKLNFQKALIAKKIGKPLHWEEYFEHIIQQHLKRESFKDWLYSLVIFSIVTLIITFPLLLASSSNIITIILSILIIALLVTLFSVYLLTPWTLRENRPYVDNPKISQFVEFLSRKANVPAPKLMVNSTPEINAMVYSSISGNRLCLTRGFIDAYNQGKFTDEELQAILGHELGHIKHGDCLKWGLTISWLTIFDVIGTFCMVLGSGILLVDTLSKSESRENPGPGLRTIGFVLIVIGIIQRIVGKIASILAYHLSRKHEFDADLVGAELVSPDAKISALQKIENLNQQLVIEKLKLLPLSDHWQAQPRHLSFIDKIFSTHPPIDSRIKELQSVNEYLKYTPNETSIPSVVQDQSITPSPPASSNLNTPQNQSISPPLAADAPKTHQNQIPASAPVSTSPKNTKIPAIIAICIIGFLIFSFIPLFPITLERQEAYQEQYQSLEPTGSVDLQYWFDSQNSPMYWANGTIFMTIKNTDDTGGTFNAYVTVTNSMGYNSYTSETKSIYINKGETGTIWVKAGKTFSASDRGRWTISGTKTVYSTITKIRTAYKPVKYTKVVSLVQLISGIKSND